MEASISFKSLSKKIDKKSILAGLSFGIEKHSNFSFYGPISSGKSAMKRKKMIDSAAACVILEHFYWSRSLDK